ERHHLEAILVGNAAAALQGATVTTIDIDFLFRRSPANIRKLKAIADELDAVVLRPYYPVSPLWRVVRDSDALQLDFMEAIRHPFLRRTTQTQCREADRQCHTAGGCSR